MTPRNSITRQPAATGPDVVYHADKELWCAYADGSFVGSDPSSQAAWALARRVCFEVTEAVEVAVTVEDGETEYQCGDTAIWRNADGTFDALFGINEIDGITRDELHRELHRRARSIEALIARVL